MRPGFRKMLQLDMSYYHAKYHRHTTWRFEDIRSRNYDELYRNFSCNYDVTSSPIDTNLNNSFIASNYCNYMVNLKEIGRFLWKLQI